MKATKRAVARWLLELMGRQVPQSVVDAKRNAETATSAFAARFEAAAFCQASQDTIAGAERYWNEASVSRALDTWCKANLGAPDVSYPPEVDAAPLSPSGKHAYARFLRADDDVSAIAALGLMRDLEPEAFDWVAHNDLRAASFVVGRGWRLAMSAEELRQEWDDEDAVRARARALMTNFHDAVARHPSDQAGVSTFSNWSAVIWQQTAAALTGALAMNARHLLPILHEEMTADRYTSAEPVGRPRLFGG